MKTYTYIFGLVAIALPQIAGAACSNANLTRCMDSVCAINISSNPAARCQYCGSSDAGTPPTDNGMRSVSVGASAKYTLTDKELKKAPTDPTQRYAWAARECIKRVDGCTPDDITDNYNQLIEQSCRAAGIAASMENLLIAAAKPVSRAECQTKIIACMVDTTRCTSDWRNCAENADFDGFFSTCSVNATGCDEHLNSLRDDMLASRDAAIENADAVLQSIVKSYQTARTRKLSSTLEACQNNTPRENCIATVCANNMANKCAAGFESEKSMATQLCKFYDLACNILKK